VASVVDNELMNGQPSPAERDAQLMRGLPQTLHSPLTPSGEIEQAGKIADGLRASRVGWRRIVVPAGLALIAAAMMATVLVWILAGH
jgi:hypothetical protein